MSEVRSKPKKLIELSDGELADRWGDVKARCETATEQIDALKEEFERRKLDFAKGLRFKVTKDVANQMRFDAKAARAALGKDADKYEKASTRTAYLVREVTEAAA